MIMKNLPKHNASIIHWEIIQHVFVQMDHLMSVQPLPAFTLTLFRSELVRVVIQNFSKTIVVQFVFEVIG